MGRNSQPAEEGLRKISFYYFLDCEWSLILAMAIGRNIHTRGSIFGTPFALRRLEISRACVCVFRRPTIAIAKIRDYSQSNYFCFRSFLFVSLFVCLFVRSFFNFVELDMKYCRYLGCLLEIFEITLTPYKIPRLKQGYQAR